MFTIFILYFFYSFQQAFGIYVTQNGNGEIIVPQFTQFPAHGTDRRAIPNGFKNMPILNLQQLQSFLNPLAGIRTLNANNQPKVINLSTYMQNAPIRPRENNKEPFYFENHSPVTNEPENLKNKAAEKFPDQQPEKFPRQNQEEAYMKSANNYNLQSYPVQSIGNQLPTLGMLAYFPHSIETNLRNYRAVLTITGQPNQIEAQFSPSRYQTQVYNSQFNTVKPIYEYENQLPSKLNG